jgi:hypothetical protein
MNNMKLTYKTVFAASLIMTAATAFAGPTDVQDSTGVPGDNFSLEGALAMFKKAGSPEEFEKLINTEDNKVNNLDLNGDGDIDYVRVIDKTGDDAHAFILQAAISGTENQDIAVIELEQTGKEEAVLQIVGDEDIYGEEVIVEPAPEKNLTQATSSKNVVVNVWAWPSVRYVYAPSYVLWVSPWGWRARPVWYRPWRPVHYHVFYPFRVPHRNHFVIVHTHRVVRAHRIYMPYRATSVTVRTRNEASLTRYRTTHTTKIVTSPHRSDKHVKAAHKTKTVHGKHGRATKSSTVVRKRKR